MVSKGVEQTEDMTAVVGKEVQWRADMNEGVDRMEGDMDMVEEKLEADSSREGRAETDKEKSVHLGKPGEAFLADHIDRKALQKQWEYQ